MFPGLLENGPRSTGILDADKEGVIHGEGAGHGGREGEKGYAQNTEITLQLRHMKNS